MVKQIQFRPWLCKWEFVALTVVHEGEEKTPFLSKERNWDGQTVIPLSSGTARG